jgi:hypothetical protein
MMNHNQTGPTQTACAGHCKAIRQAAVRGVAKGLHSHAIIAHAVIGAVGAVADFSAGGVEEGFRMRDALHRIDARRLRRKAKP